MNSSTKTADKSKIEAMIEGYTISNNDPSEMAYDLALNKTTIREKKNIASNINAINNINITSNNGDNLIVGSNLNAGNDVNLNAINGKNIITSAEDESFFANSKVDQDYNDISFSADRGRLAVNSTSNVYEEDSKTTKVTQVASNLNSGNNINLIAKSDIDILSSNLNSNNQINLTSSEGTVNILANSNKTLSEKEIREGSLTLSAGVGHVAVDVAFAEYDLIKAIKDAADAKKELNHIENLHKQGKADKEAVEDAKTNLAISTLNVLLADLKLAAVAAKAVESSKTLGFYADATLTRTGQKTNSNSSDNQEIGSNIIANGNINISSGLSLTNEQAQENRDLGNTNIKGILTSNNGDINIISANDTNITALKSTSSSSSKSEGFSTTITLASSASASSKAFEQAINSLTASIGAGTNSSKSDASSTTYTNTQLTASNGNIKINSGNDATIKGANILAENTILNTQNNLTIESLQNTANSKSKSKSINAGAGGNAGGLSSISLGYNSNKSSFERNWVDDQTTIIGTNSVVINTGNNTHNKGALIANITNAVSNPPLEGGSQSLAMRGGVNYIGSELIDGNNLTINTGTLTFENIFDSETQKSSGFGVNLSNISFSGNTTTSSDLNQTNIVQETNYYPKGSTTLSLQNSGYTKEQTTKATVGGGNITIGSTQIFNTDATSNDYGNLVSSSGGTLVSSSDGLVNNSSVLGDLNRDIKSSQEITKDTITGALDVSATIDNRILAAGYEILTNQEEKIQNDPTLTNKEKEQRIAALNGNVLKNEFLNQGSNIAKSNKELAKLPGEITDIGVGAGLAIYDKFVPSDITDPKIKETLRNQIRKEIRLGIVDGEINRSDLRAKVKDITGKTPTPRELDAIIELETKRDFGQLMDDIGYGSYIRFLDKYALATLIAFDGTDNNKKRDYNVDPAKDKSTNVAKMSENYGTDARIYVDGIGTSGDIKTDSLCQTTGCGISNKQQQAQKDLFEKVINREKNQEFLFFALDVLDFSRGATTGSDFINKINNENYWNLGILTRSHLMFDPVGSYGSPGNNNDLGKNFSTPTNIIAIQINAKNENRNLFDLQSLSDSKGKLAGKHWKEITLPGMHSDIGGGNENGYQGKDQQMALYSMQTMINEASQYGIRFNEMPTYQPTSEFNQLMNFYNQANSSYKANPNQENQTRLQGIEGMIKDSSVTNSSWNLFSKEWYKAYNYSIGSERGKYYPNDKYLNNSTSN